ncbi:MAG TPA: hypothetical protein VLS49_05460 [Usitatibacter sp.]|nr:hypothetical protein [Usitatibacter sp.]
MHGLRNEVDAILGTGAHRFTIPTAYGPVRLPDLPQLVTVVGGGYFFLPSRTALRFLGQLTRDAKPVAHGAAEAIAADAGALPEPEGLLR